MWVLVSLGIILLISAFTDPRVALLLGVIGLGIWSVLFAGLSVLRRTYHGVAIDGGAVEIPYYIFGLIRIVRRVPARDLRFFEYASSTWMGNGRVIELRRVSDITDNLCLIGEGKVEFGSKFTLWNLQAFLDALKSEQEHMEMAGDPIADPDNPYSGRPDMEQAVLKGVRRAKHVSYALLLSLPAAALAVFALTNDFAVASAVAVIALFPFVAMLLFFFADDLSASFREAKRIRRSRSASSP